MRKKKDEDYLEDVFWEWEVEFLSFWERIEIEKKWFKKESNDIQIAATYSKSTIWRLYLQTEVVLDDCKKSFQSRQLEPKNLLFAIVFAFPFLPRTSLAVLSV